MPWYQNFAEASMTIIMYIIHSCTNFTMTIIMYISCIGSVIHSKTHMEQMPWTKLRKLQKEEGNSIRFFLVELCSLPPPRQICNHSVATNCCSYIHKPTNCNGGINNRYGKVITTPCTSPCRRIHQSNLYFL